MYYAMVPVVLEALATRCARDTASRTATRCARDTASRTANTVCQRYRGLYERTSTYVGCSTACK